MNSSVPLVSIVMPSFNQEHFIEAAVRSVLEQDYPSLELIIADGGSTDGTLQCLEGLLAHFGNRLRWISEPDSGPANAINKALGMVRGAIIGWLNSDDLYAPGAVRAAVHCLTTRPETLMVYGEGEHIDENGKRLGRYPTLPPSASPEVFQKGCFICQPTVFLRLEVLQRVGFLDESLKTAFDFELWLRIFQQFPERIALLDQVLASSRIHAACITSQQRRLIAMENIRVLSKYFGHAQPHWLLTYAEELCQNYPFGAESGDMQALVHEALSEAAGYIEAHDLAQLKETLAQDARFRLAVPGIFAAVYSDGWAPPTLAIRLRGTGGKHLLLHCEHRWPVFQPIRLEITGSWGSVFSMTVEKPGPFTIAMTVPDRYAFTRSFIVIKSENSFVPQQVEAHSTDTRHLVFKVSGVEFK